MVSFSTISANTLTPGVYIEFDSSRALAGLPGKPHKALVLGLRRSTGTIAENIATQVATSQLGDAYFGVGSQLAEMIRVFKLNNPNTDCWAIGMDEEAGGTAAKFTIAVTASSAGAGSIALYIGGYRFLVPVAAGDSATTIATAIGAEINKETRAPFTASASSATVAVTFRHKGTSGNYMVPFVNMRSGEAYPSGVSLAMTNTLTITGGTGTNGNFTTTIGSLAGVTTALTSASHSTAILTAQAIKASLEATTPGYTISGSSAILTFSFPLGYESGTSIAVSAGATGVTSTIAGDGALGATDPSFSGPIDAFGDTTQWDTIVCPWADDTNLDLLEAELLARDAGDVMLDGNAFCAVRATSAALTTLGNARNNQFTSLVGYPTSPDFPWVVASAVAAQDAKEPDPARPRQRLPLLGVLGPKAADEFTRATRNTLLTDGVSTLLRDAAGAVRIERLITTYQSNATGVPDTAYRDITTVRTISYLRWAWNAVVSSKYPRHKLAADGTLFAPGQAIVTPSLMKSEALAWFRGVENIGLVEDFEQFKDDLICQINGSDPNRLDMQMTFNLVNGLVVFATKMQFVL